jgi:hypothetical protein
MGTVYVCEGGSKSADTVCGGGGVGRDSVRVCVCACVRTLAQQ